MQATLLDIPQPEELPNEVDLLTAEDLDRYLSQLEPCLAFNGYKPTLWGDWLEFNALEVEDTLVDLRSTAEDDGYERDFESASQTFFLLIDSGSLTNTRVFFNRSEWDTRRKAGHDARDAAADAPICSRLPIHLGLWSLRKDSGCKSVLNG